MRIAIHSASAAIRRTLELAVAQSGHHLVTLAQTPDMVIDDSLNPLQSPSSLTPTLQLVAQGTASERVMVGPIRPQDLIQRLMMLGSLQTIALDHGWTLDMQARTLAHPTAAAVTLTEKECALLKQLATAYPAPLTREDLLEHVWGMAGDIDTHTLETHIYRLRAKLDSLSPTPCDIVTQDGAYLLVTNH